MKGPESIVSTHKLTKRFGDRTVVDAINLEVRPGEIFGFLGPNGAGKTTTLRMILGLLSPTYGEVRLFGHLVRRRTPALHHRIGVVAEIPIFYEDMTVEQYLLFFAQVFGVEDARARIAMLLERLDLHRHAGNLAPTLSRGMQQKLALARALLPRPALLILDEPISNLDPNGIILVRELLEEQRALGVAILLSSHILSEVERSADRVGIISRGRLVAEGDMEYLRTRLGMERRLEIEFVGQSDAVRQALSGIEGVRQIDGSDGVLVVTLLSDSDLRPTISQAVTGAGGIVIGMAESQISLEEAFIRLTQDRVEQLAW